MDYYQDSGHLFAKLFYDRELPDFAKTANYETEETLSGLPDSAFADPVARAYPMHDRAHVYIGAAYCYAQPHDKQAAACLPVLVKQAQLLGMAGELPALQDYVKTQFSRPEVNPKVAEWENKTAAFSIEFGTSKIASVAGRGKVAAEKAIDRFLEVYAEIPSESRTKVASELIVAGKENGVEPSEDLLKFAGQAEHDNVQFCNQIALRASLVPDVLHKNAVWELAKENPKGDVEKLKAKVAALAAFDAVHKLAHYYGERVLDPHRAVFNLIPKQAAVIEVGLKRYPAGNWTGPACDFQKGLEAALGHEKAAGLVSEDGTLKTAELANLSEGEAALVNRYLA
jgi:hypothetical protein